MKRRTFLKALGIGAASVALPAPPVATPVVAAPVLTTFAATPGTLALTRTIAIPWRAVAAEYTGFSGAFHDDGGYLFPGLVREEYAREKWGDKLDALIADGTFKRPA